MNQTAVALLERRRNRAIAIVLGVKEREVDPYLTQSIRDKLRKVVLDQFNDYHETVLDVLRSTDGDDEVALNQIYFEAIEGIRQSIGELASLVSTGE